ncbi:MAG: sterol desaturase family protein [Chlorobi bacterium]|nr:sterol desaturase family protein [Chlorobiota bacterium]
MSFINFEILATSIVILCRVVIISLERLFPYNAHQSLLRKGFWNDLGMYTLVQSFVLSQIIFGFAYWLDGITELSSYGLLSSWPIWGQVLLSLVVHDFYIYWFHRWQHHNRYLWRTHEAHHSTEDVDWLSGPRSHSLEILINQTVEFAPLILLGCAPETIAIKGMLDAVWGMYIHSNINIRSGVLQYVINGPEMHRWHHAIDHEAHNMNFGTKFAIWDWIFGTAFFPSGRKPVGYGLGDENFPENYFKQHAWAFRRFRKK